jgi:ribosome biogenesis GTPase
VINKVDLLSNSPDETERYKEFLAAYELLGFPILSISTKTGAGIQAFQSIMKDKTSVIAGQSGVGKSSLLNVAFNLDLRIGDLGKTSKGTHTTTTALLLPLQGGGSCIDTPGVRSFGVWSLSKDEVTTHFTEIKTLSKKCHFPDCSHTSEPKCAVLRALEKGKLSPIRYESYESLLGESLGDIDNRTRKKLED